MRQRLFGQAGCFSLVVYGLGSDYDEDEDLRLITCKFELGFRKKAVGPDRSGFWVDSVCVLFSFAEAAE